MSVLRSCPIPAVTGAAVTLAEDLVRVTAQNAAPISGPGTNSYILGKADLVVIDPGPEDSLHREHLLHIINGRRVKAILMTHAHRDHSDGVADLVRATDAPVWANGPARRGRSETMQRLCARGIVQESNGTDYDFIPDHDMPDGSVFELEGAAIKAIHTPGHLSHHLCFAWRDMVFTGDHVMGWTSTVVIPPDGDMLQYMQSLERLSADFADAVGLPGHGATIPSLGPRVMALHEHRLRRQSAVLAAVSKHPRTLGEITASTYHDTPTDLLPFALQSCLSQLVAFADSGDVVMDDTAQELLFSLNCALSHGHPVRAAD